jgi:hypothetical protein
MASGSRVDRVRATAAVDGGQVAGSLVPLVRGCSGVAEEQEVSWAPARWEAALGGLDGVPEEAVRSGSISRRHGREAATAARRGEIGPRGFLITAMAWGFGAIGYGPWRTAAMLATPGVEDRVAAILRIAHRDGARAVYEAVSGPYRLPRLGPVFATKLIYFAGHDSIAPGPKPLVLDRVVGTLLAHHGAPLRWQAFHADSYLTYLDLVTTLAARANATPDDVECKLWEVGAGAAAPTG